MEIFPFCCQEPSACDSPLDFTYFSERAHPTAGAQQNRTAIIVIWRILNLQVGLCDMDKNYISRFFDFFFDFDFNHDFDTNRHALFYTSYLFLHILSCTSCFALFLILLHILLFISFFTYIYALVWCYFDIIFILCTVHWADLIWSTFHFWLYPV